MGSAAGSGGRALRSDAQRSMAAIREAALRVFAEQGLRSPLDDVARAAGVSKGTIYHRYGGRQGLIDAVVEELVAEAITGIIRAVEALDDPIERFETYLRMVWMLQYDEPAANDVFLRAMPDSAPATELCDTASRFAATLLADAQATGVLRADLTMADVATLIWERGILARVCEQQPRADYERRLTFVLHGLRAAAAWDGCDPGVSHCGRARGQG